MRKRAVLVVLAAGAAVLSGSVFGRDGTVRVRAGVAMVNYTGPSGSGADFESAYSAATVGGSYVAASGWFVDLGLRQSLGADWNAKDFGFASDGDLDRQETTLSGGKALGNGVSAFGGVQFARNEYKHSQPGVGTTIRSNTTLLFVGASKALPLGRGGLSLSGALGVLDQEGDGTAAGSSASVRSDSGYGYSLGAAYGLPLSNRLSVQGDLRYQSYSGENVGSLGASVVLQF